MTTRAAAFTALTTLVQNAYAWVQPVSDRLQTIDQVPPSQRPCCFVFTGGIESYKWQMQPLPERTIPARLYIYTAAGDSVDSDAAVQGCILDALDAAFLPSGSDIGIGRNTLSGAIYRIQIKRVLKVPGDLLGDGMIVIDLALVLP